MLLVLLQRVQRIWTKMPCLYNGFVTCDSFSKSRNLNRRGPITPVSRGRDRGDAVGHHSHDVQEELSAWLKPELLTWPRHEHRALRALRRLLPQTLIYSRG